MYQINILRIVWKFLKNFSSTLIFCELVIFIFAQLLKFWLSRSWILWLNGSLFDLSFGKTGFMAITIPSSNQFFWTIFYFNEFHTIGSKLIGLIKWFNISLTNWLSTGRERIGIKGFHRCLLSYIPDKGHYLLIS